MPARVHVFGASGSGTTSLAAVLAARHGHRHLDTDDFFGLYFVQASREGVTAFFRWTVWGRSIVVVAFVAFVALGMAPPVLILFAAIDAGGALWTALTLRGGR
jgi:hypothetical protein